MRLTDSAGRLLPAGGGHRLLAGFPTEAP